jgi:apolipoprotein D and lipocalin family protein
MPRSRLERWLVTAAAALALGGCVGPPEGVEAVEGIELERYLGRWYEIARLDHPFERNLEKVTATYSPREDDGIRVVNRGYNVKTDEWEEAVGKAYFVEDPNVGQLKVSFFGPFYGGYNIIALDKDDYQWVMIAGPTRDYLWILAREPQLEPAIVERLVEEAESLGFPTEELIYVEH